MVKPPKLGKLLISSACGGKARQVACRILRENLSFPHFFA